MTHIIWVTPTSNWTNFLKIDCLFEANLLDSEPYFDRVFVLSEHSSRQWLKLRSQLELGLFGYVKYVFDQLQRITRFFDQRLWNQTVYLFVWQSNNTWWNIKYVQNIDINLVSNSQSNWHVVKNMASTQMSFYFYKSWKIFSPIFILCENSTFEQPISEKVTLSWSKDFQIFMIGYKVKKNWIDFK